MTQAIEPPAAPVGLTQPELIDFGSHLRGLGIDEQTIHTITHRLVTIANEAAFKGAATMATTITQVRQDEQKRYQSYTDAVLRRLQVQLMSTRTVFGYMDKQTVLATIQQAIQGQDKALVIEGARP